MRGLPSSFFFSSSGGIKILDTAAPKSSSDPISIAAEAAKDDAVSGAALIIREYGGAPFGIDTGSRCGFMIMRIYVYLYVENRFEKLYSWDWRIPTNCLRFG